jgi:ferredoxin
MQLLLRAFRLPGAITLVQALDSPEPEAVHSTGMTRRGFFGLLRGGGARAADSLLPDPKSRVRTKVRPPRGDTATLPTRRARLIECLRALSPDGCTQEEVASPLRAPVLDRAKCNGCAICGRICPTGALQVEETPGETDAVRVMERPSACVECGLCTEACGEQALALAHITAGRVLSPAEPAATFLERTPGEQASYAASQLTPMLLASHPSESLFGTQGPPEGPDGLQTEPV